MSLELTQAEADQLISMKKAKINDLAITFPHLGEKISVDLVSLDQREPFLLDINRSAISLSKVTYQNRARSVFILVRLDLGGAPHRNPDGEELLCPHIHLYREGYGDKWAFAVPDTFLSLSDNWITLYDFMTYCNIIDPPHFERSLLA
jgi:hypothetical protein